MNKISLKNIDQNESPSLVVIEILQSVEQWQKLVHLQALPLPQAVRIVVIEQGQPTSGSLPKTANVTIPDESEGIVLTAGTTYLISPNWGLDAGKLIPNKAPFDLLSSAKTLNSSAIALVLCSKTNGHLSATLSKMAGEVFLVQVSDGLKSHFKNDSIIDEIEKVKDNEINAVLKGYFQGWSRKSSREVNSHNRTNGTKLAQFLNNPHFQKLFENGLDAVAILDEYGQAKYASPSVTKVLGYSADEILSLNLYNLLHPEDVEAVADLMQDVINNPGKTLAGVTARTKHKNGSWRWLEATVTNMLHDPEIAGIVDNFRDVTERYTAHSALRESEENYRRLFDSSPLPKWIYRESDFSMVDVNQKAIATYGYSREEFLNLSAEELRPEYERAMFVALHRSPEAATQQSFYGVSTHCTKSGSLLRMEITANRIVYRQESCIAVVANDITTLEEKQKELDSRDRKLKAAAEIAQLGYWHLNPDGESLWWSDEVYRIWEWDRTIPLTYQTFFETIHPSDRENFQKEQDKSFRGEQEHNFKHRIITHRGNVKWVHELGRLIIDETGQPNLFEGTVQDVTKQVEEEMRLRLFENVVKNTTDAVMITEAEPFEEPGPKILFVNDAFCKMTGYEASEIIGKTPRILQGPKSDKSELSSFGKAIRKWESAQVTTINYKKSGEEFWINFSVTPIADEHGWYTHWIAIERDVTLFKQQELQKELLADISTAFNKNETLFKALHAALDKLLEYDEFDTAEIWLPDSERSNIKLAAQAYATELGSKFNELSAGITFFPFGEGLPGEVWRTEKILECTDLTREKRFKRVELAIESGMKQCIGVPLFDDTSFQGVLLLFTSKERLQLSYIAVLISQLQGFIGAEIKRKRLEQELNNIFTYAPDIIAVAGFDGFLKRVNPVTVKLLEYSEAEILNTPFIDFVHPEDRDLTQSHFSEMLNGAASINFENRYITKSGKTIWLSWTSTISSDEGIIFAVAKDITQTKELEQLLERASTMARIGSWEADFQSKTVYFSKVTREIHELENDDDIFSFDVAVAYYREDIRPLVTKIINDAIENKKDFEYEYPIITAKGNERWIRAIGKVEFRNNLPHKITGSFQDVHNRKTTELRLQTTTNNVPGVIFQYELFPDGTDRLNNVSEGARKVWDIDPQDAMRDASVVWNLVLPEDIPQLQQSIMRSANDLSRWQHQWRVMRRGEIRWVEGHGTPRKRPSGKVIWDTVVFDITEKKELENLVEQSARMAMIGSWEVNLREANQPIVYWSPTMRDIFETDEQYIPKEKYGIDFFTEKSKDILINAIQSLIKYGETFDLELKVVTTKSTSKWVRLLGDSDRKAEVCTRIFGSIQDISEIKENQIALTLRTRYLETISGIVSLFLRHISWEEVIEQAFDLCGRVTGVDRVYYFERHKHPDTGEWVCSQRFEWTNGEASSQFNNPLLQNIEETAFTDFFEPLLQNRPFMAVTEELPTGPLKDALAEQDIQSCLCLPLTVSTTFYGFIGFDDCTSPRNWSSEQLFFLRSLAANLSSAIQRKNDRERLLETLEERSIILESIGDGFITVDRKWNITSWNKAAEAILNLKSESTLGKSLWEIYPQEVDGVFYKAYHRAMETNESIHFESFFEQLQLWVDISAYPSEKGLSIFFKDITQRIHAEQQIRLSNERFTMASKATNDAVWDWDVENDSLYWSEGFTTLFGWPRDVGLPNLNTWNDNIHPEDRDWVLTEVQEMLDNPQVEKWEGEYRYLKHDGTYAFVLDRGYILRNKNGEAIRMVGAMSDITYRKDYERSLQRLNEQLAKRAEELNRSNRELEQFAYVASHDLQEPLRMVTSFLTQLDKKYHNQLDEKAHQYIYYAVDGAKRMRQIILDLLEFSRVGKHTDKLTEVNFNDLVNDILKLQHKMIEEKEAEVQVDKLPTLSTYRTPATQVFQNIISNALKYTPADRKPRVVISAIEQENTVLFAIKDNGIGIKEEYFDKIFIIFQRLHNKEQFQGTGMGLSIVKKIVENLKGKIWLESVVNEGTTFYIEWPKVLPQ